MERESLSRAQAHRREFNPSFRSLAHGLQAVESAMQANRQSSAPDPWEQVARDIGTIMRFVTAIQETMEYSKEKRRREGVQTCKPLDFAPDLPAPVKQPQERPGEKAGPPEKESTFQKFVRERTRYILPKSPDRGPEMEPDF